MSILNHRQTYRVQHARSGPVFCRRLAAVLGLLLLMVTSAKVQPLTGDSAALYLQEQYRGFDAPINAEWYLIRPGDRLRATFIGVKINPMTLTVDPEGQIVDPTLGIIDLRNATLAEAQTKLDAILKKHFTVDEIAISVVSPQRVSITVSGAVAEPGMYLGFTSQQVSEIIEKAGGISALGSRRRILFEWDRGFKTVDLDRAYYLGEDSFNPYLYAGTHIHVPARALEVVHVVGEAVTPREIELVEGDDVSRLIALAGGFSRYADTTRVQVRSADGRDRRRDGDLQSGDVIFIPRVEQSQLRAQVKLLGAVQEPGVYKFEAGMTLSELLDRAGGHGERANLPLTSIFRSIVDEEGVRAGGRHFPIAAAPGEFSRFRNTELRPNDSVYVPTYLGYVRVRGAVPSPGFVAFEDGATATDYIEKCGGFLSGADRQWVRLYNRVADTYSLQSPKVVVRDGDEIEVRRQETIR